jgi:hypothetical protein
VCQPRCCHRIVCVVDGVVQSKFKLLIVGGAPCTPPPLLRTTPTHTTLTRVRNADTENKVQETSFEETLTVKTPIVLRWSADNKIHLEFSVYLGWQLQIF